MLKTDREEVEEEVEEEEGEGEEEEEEEEEVETTGSGAPGGHNGLSESAAAGKSEATRRRPRAIGGVEVE
jgi:hypothetical protein